MEFEQHMSIEGERKEVLMEVRVQRITDGLGFGEGGISHTERQDVDTETLDRVENVLTSPDILVPVEADDDGCGDGREVGVIYEGDEIRNRSLNRSKVFGGGAMMSAAARIGLGHARGENLYETIDEARSLLIDRGLPYGAHTGPHASEEKSDCGAIDKAPIIITNVEKYRNEIAGTITALGIDTTGLDEVINAFGEYGKAIQGQDYSGAKVVNGIRREGRVVKELKDEHLEMYIALNNVPGMTINQEKVREISGGKVQVFGVDVWRMQEQSTSMYPEDKGFSDADRHEAFLSELVYTLSTAATLTKGDLPVYMVSSQAELVAA